MADLGYPFRQARNYSVGRQGYSTIWIVRHCTADDYEDDYARKLGNYFATTDVSVSTHYGVDGTEPWQYVLHKDTAYGARNPANLRGIHIEYCGHVHYSREKWLSLDAMLRHGAKLEAQLYRTLRIPHRRLTVAQLNARAAGYTTHNDVRIAFGGTHTDPGANFPHDVLDRYIAAELAGTPMEDDVALDESMVEYQGYGTMGGTLATTLGYSRDARAQTAGLEAKIDHLLAAAGEEVQRDADAAARDAVLLQKVEQVQAGDPQALADLLGPMLTVDLLDALRARLES